MSAEKLTSWWSLRTAKKAVAQVERAAEVVRRLRALVRLDRTNRAPCVRAVKETIELCQPDLDPFHVTIRLAVAADLPAVMIDLLQIEQVLINLLRNAIEAIGESGSMRGSIVIEAKVVDADFVEVRVADNRTRLSPRLLESAFLPLSSNKAEGLGIGLPLCRSIVEAHGGQLWLDTGTDGAAIRFTLPIAKTSQP